MGDCCCCSQSDKPKKTLDGFFTPRGVAVIGASASPSKIGYQILNNVIAGGFQGGIYPVNPKEDMILGKKAYKSVKDIPGPVDLAVITVPAPHVIPALEECAVKGVRNAAIITSGFGEVGNHADEDKIKEIADKNGIAFLGPNILGLLYMPTKLNASFGPQNVLPGKIAFISQSGALAIALMGWTAMEKIGLASLCSLGNKADIGETELIEYFNQDKNVDVILVYMEGIKNGRQFLNTEIKKPVIVLKVGRSTRGAKAAASHTGSLAGADGIFDAVFKQMGILRADSFLEAFGWARIFSLPMPKGDNLVMITNGGGIGVAATDECEAAGIGMMEDPAWLEAKFRCTMPDFGSTKNPVDITGGSGVQGYRDAAKIAFAERKIDSVLVLYCETAVTNPVDVAKAVLEEYQAAGKNKPVTVVMVGGERSRAAIHFLNQSGVPAFGEVKEAVSALKCLYTWRDYQTRAKDVLFDNRPSKEVIDYLNKIRGEGRSALLEHEARKVLEMCGVPMPKWGFAISAADAVRQAEGMYPLAMKIASPDILHKSDVGGVVLNIRNQDELQHKYQEMMTRVTKAMPQAKILGVNLIQMVSGIECIVGMSEDAQFGPVMMFGLGGVFVEALKDVSFRVVPFGPVEAERLINSIKAKKILNGFRGMSGHKGDIIKTMCAVQKLASLVKEVDVNPLITNKDGAFAADARIIL
ncbi:MAG: acetate--CoA ligase family protein [Candidatus Omnitrophica bacterium]|nr:acetate--CoA ligase family protein [Candidatus Omnitrophota bacterium]